MNERLVEALVERGIRRSVAEDLAAKHPDATDVAPLAGLIAAEYEKSSEWWEGFKADLREKREAEARKTSAAERMRLPGHRRGSG